MSAPCTGHAAESDWSAKRKNMEEERSAYAAHLAGLKPGDEVVYVTYRRFGAGKDISILRVTRRTPKRIFAWPVDPSGKFYGCEMQYNADTGNLIGGQYGSRFPRASTPEEIAEARAEILLRMQRRRLDAYNWRSAPPELINEVMRVIDAHEALAALGTQEVSE